ncbi:unnamed protein product [Agarophyton chilense]
MRNGAPITGFLPCAAGGFGRALFQSGHRWRNGRNETRSQTRCTLSAQRSCARRCQALTVEACRLDGFSSDFVRELRRLVRSPWFISRVRDRIEWPYFRFSGVLFVRREIGYTDEHDEDDEHDEHDEHEDGGDGIPGAVRQLARRADMKLVDIPPLVVQHAATSSKQPLRSGVQRIVAVFETYGHCSGALPEMQNRRVQFENDLLKQRRAWADHRDIRRNETVIMGLHGADPFDDHYLDYYLRLSTQTTPAAPDASRAAQPHSRSRSRASRSSSILFGVPIALTFSLGVWQLYRLRRKHTLIVERQLRLSSAPIDTASLFQHADTDHRRIQLTGRFLHEHEMLVGPRSAPKHTPMPVLQWGGSTGLQVITPLKTDDGSIVLVNRGWIPQRLSARSRRHNPQLSPYSFITKFDRHATYCDYHDSSVLSPQVSFVGVVRSTDERNRFTPKNAPSKDEWFYVDANAMLHAHGLEGCERLVELVEPHPQAGWPFPRSLESYAEFRTPPSTHITYAVTWFSLSACIALLTRFRARQKRTF